MYSQFWNRITFCLNFSAGTGLEKAKHTALMIFPSPSFFIVYTFKYLILSSVSELTFMGVFVLVPTQHSVHDTYVFCCRQLCFVIFITA